MLRLRQLSNILVALLLSPAFFSAKADPAMWVIRDADSTIYLIGTMHLLKHDAEWNSAKVKKTVHDSTELWLEVADFANDAAVAPLMAKFGMDPQHPLSSKLNAEQKKKLEKLSTTYGVPASMFEPMRPWLAAIILSAMPILKAGYDPKAGVERMLAAQAKEEGDKINGFETAEEQFGFFASLSEKEQLAFLKGTLDELEKGIELLDRLAKAWIEGDTDTIGQLAIDEIKTEAPAVYDKILVQRNVAWAKKIEEILKGAGVQQVAVGAAHLAGPDSVQAQLARRGIKVEKY